MEKSRKKKLVRNRIEQIFNISFMLFFNESNNGIGKNITPTNGIHIDAQFENIK